jgi:aminomethyltransferase
MPLQYEGVIAEHTAVRTAAGLFDVSHLGKLRVGGPGAGDALQVALTADVAALEPGTATYSLVLTDDAGCIDDVFAYRMGKDEWLVVPNASNVSPVAEAISASGDGFELVDEWDRWAILALQGPDSFEIFEQAWPSSPAPSLGLHEWCEIDVMGEMGIVARTGYTGERGFELYAPAATALQAWSAVVDVGARPVGLGARDTLRLEMGYALYGHEITLDVNPIEASLGWVLAWDTPFRGRDALAKVKAEGAARKLWGVVCRGRGVPRQGMTAFVDGSAAGIVTSGNYSPTLGTGIALVMGPAASVPEPGAEVAIEARGRRIEGDIVKPPFVRKPTSTPGSS